MALVLRLIGSWLYNTHNYRDAKLEHYPIFNYPFFGILTIIVYSNLVTSILPKFMKNREPYNLKSFILVYNAFQIVFNGIIVVKILSIVFNSRFDPFRCFESDINESTRAIVLYFFNKLTDLIETVVFVLRKKHSQVSALHLIHHAQVVLYSHYALFLDQHGSGLHCTCINSAVHVLMYTYYFTNAYGFKSNWTMILKKSITKIQMIQFVVALALCCTIFFPDCKVPNHFGGLLVHQLFLMLFMFYCFYKKTYTKNVKQE